MTRKDGDHLKTRLAAVPYEHRDRIEHILRSRLASLRLERNAHLLSQLTPEEARQRMSEVAAELRRRIGAGAVTDPDLLERFRAAAEELELRSSTNWPAK